MWSDFYDHYDGYFGYGCESGNYGRCARKSGAAERRESTARLAFTKALKSTPIPLSAVTVTNLLKPSTHLTNASWSDFSKWVKTHTGCKAVCVGHCYSIPARTHNLT